MKVAIDIPDHMYNTVVETGRFFPYRFNAAKAIKNGKAIPNGRLIDADALKKEYKSGNWDLHKVLDVAPTIIEVTDE